MISSSGVKSKLQNNMQLNMFVCKNSSQKLEKPFVMETWGKIFLGPKSSI